MSIILNQVFSLIKLLNSDKGTNQIAAGFAAGFVLGMTPAFSLQTILIIFLIFFFRIQLGAALVSAFFFKFAAFLLDPLFHATGTWVLELPVLHGVFTMLYDLPLIPYTRFNNSIVMGSAVISLLCFFPCFFLSRWLIQRYRVKVVERFQSSKFWRAFKATSFYQWYYKYDQLA